MIREFGKLLGIHPLLAAKVKAAALALEADDIDVVVCAGLRTHEEQAELYAKGRTTPGPKVTNAAPGYGWHEFGLAVDVAPIGHDRQSRIRWNANDPMWAAIEAAMAREGLVCGANWRTFPDAPHVQLTGRFPATPSDEVRRIYDESESREEGTGIDAVWAASGLEMPAEEEKGAELIRVPADPNPPALTEEKPPAIETQQGNAGESTTVASAEAETAAGASNGEGADPTAPNAAPEGDLADGK